MPAQIDLVLLDAGNRAPPWPLGNVLSSASRPDALQSVLDEKVVSSNAVASLFWIASLGDPNPDAIASALQLPGHVWHAGLRLGTSGLPNLIDFVAPTWMLNRDPDRDIEATSWRVSLNACLIRTEVIKQLGGLDTQFQTLTGAALEMGHRYVTSGAILRHVPWLVADGERWNVERMPLEDEFRFIRLRYKKWKFAWAATRAAMTGYSKPWSIARASCAVASSISQHPKARLQHDFPAPEALSDASVSVLIPTIDRYPYLRTVLRQLREQNIPATEIIIVDQTELKRRDTKIAEEFHDLPLKIIYLDQAGQCSSRNLGLQVSTGEYVLFIDDDDEIQSDLISHHLKALASHSNSVSSGIAHEIGAETLPENFTVHRVSDVFPTNNSMIRRNALCNSGLFDLAYDHRQRADGDLGMRLYLSGELMILNPDISVLHHHAPRGGLRTHKARVITYASSRNTLHYRHIPSVSEIYLAKRYFNGRQLRESLWLRAFGTFSVRGDRVKKLVKAMFALARLPDTWLQIQRRSKEADRLLLEYPQIPQLAKKTSSDKTYG